MYFLDSFTPKLISIRTVWLKNLHLIMATRPGRQDDVETSCTSVYILLKLYSYFNGKFLNCLLGSPKPVDSHTSKYALVIAFQPLDNEWGHHSTLCTCGKTQIGNTPTKRCRQVAAFWDDLFPFHIRTGLCLFKFWNSKNLQYLTYF